MKKLILTLLLIGFQSQAQILVISDIDDTIKISHVLSKVDAVTNAGRTQNNFMGMNTLYRILVKELSKTGDVSMVYLSEAPSFLMKKSHSEFLLDNYYPPGELILPPFFGSNHKVGYIRDLIAKIHPKMLVEFGDNGQLDVEVYDQIRREYPDIKSVTFIHQVYGEKNEDHPGHPLWQDQIGFVSPVEVSFVLAQMGLMSPQVADSFATQTAPLIMNSKMDEDEGELAFPDWEDCRDFRWPAEKNDLSEKFKDLKNFILNRCARAQQPLLDPDSVTNSI